MHPKKLYSFAGRKQGFNCYCSNLVCCTAWCHLCLHNCAAIFYVMGIINLKKRKNIGPFCFGFHKSSFQCCLSFLALEHERYVKLHFPNSDYVIARVFWVRSCYVDLQQGKEKKTTQRKTWIFFMVLFPIIWMFFLRL